MIRDSPYQKNLRSDTSESEAHFYVPFRIYIYPQIPICIENSD